MSNQAYPQWLENKKGSTDLSNITQPILIDMQQLTAVQQLEELVHTQPIQQITDAYEEMVEELFFSRNPRQKFQYRQAGKSPDYVNFKKELFGARDLWQTGSWVYYPWSSQLIHVLPADLHAEVRSNRNRDLITPAEQKLFREFKVGIAGLSIGQGIAQVLSMGGGCMDLHLADMDTISLTNLNRLRLGLDSIGTSKAVKAARTITEVDPYAKPIIFTNGLTDENMDSFFDGLNAIVDEVDDFPIKVRIREEAAKRKIPVLMAADLGDAIMVDVERYDTNPKQEPFNGRLNTEKLEAIRQGQTTPELMLQAFIDVVGKDNIPAKAFQIIRGIGTTLAGPPQLGSDALLSGVCVSVALRYLAIRQNLDAGIRYINVSDILEHPQSA